jgi:hypothetical protein
MAWHQRIAQWLVADRLAEMSERVAGRSRMAVWQRVVDRLPGLTTAEMRGYVRARAIAIIASETQRLIEQEGAKISRMRGEIIAAASHSLVETIVAQMAQRRRSEPLRQAA